MLTCSDPGKIDLEGLFSFLLGGGGMGVKGGVWGVLELRFMRFKKVPQKSLGLIFQTLKNS